MLKQPLSLESYEDLLQNANQFDSLLPKLPNHPADIVNRSDDPEKTKTQILNDARSTRIIIHKRVYDLIHDFLQIKSTMGSIIEQVLYKSMSQQSFLERLILKRPLSFMGPDDETITDRKSTRL